MVARTCSSVSGAKMRKALVRDGKDCRGHLTNGKICQADNDGISREDRDERRLGLP
jgi:hypothetical protein